MTGLEDIKTLDELYSRVKEFIKGGICKDATNYVLGRGSKSPKVLFIGEAPGREEDKKGVPFCGRSGKLLDSWIKKLDIKEEDYAIINVLKCRPPNNRTPNKEEIEESKPFLMRQIELLNPEKIIVLGKVASETLIKSEDFGKGFINKCGKFYNNIYILPHPAYCLRNPNYLVPLTNFKTD